MMACVVSEKQQFMYPFVAGAREKFHSWSRLPKAFRPVVICLQFLGSISNNLKLVNI